MHKLMNGDCTEIMKNTFRISEENGYNLSHQNTFKGPIVNSVYNGTETVSLLGPKIWELIPTEIKELVSLNGFKKAIKKWKPVNCPCRLSRTYLHDVGFIILTIFTQKQKSRLYLNLIFSLLSIITVSLCFNNLF